MAGRVSQQVIEVAELGNPNARSSQLTAEVAGSGSPTARASQVTAEIAASGSASARASQIAAEVSASGSPHVRVSQFVVEVLIRSIALAIPPLYPDLPGLTYSTFWSPEHFSQSDQTASGAEIDLALAAAPIHEFELTYSVLRNTWGEGSTEFRTMFGFFLRMQGNVGRFLFHNPHDYKVTGQALFTTDGVNSVFGPIQRTFGIGDNAGTEAIGYVDLTETFNLYLDGVLQDPSTYSVLTSSPVNQQIKFNSTPATGKAVTADFSFFYYCKFKDAKLSFEEFMRELWSLQKVTIRSCRAGT